MVALIKRSPNGVFALKPFFRPFNMFEEIEDMAKSAFESGLVPTVDMYEEDKEIVVKAELPGIRKKDLDIRLDGDVLTIKAQKEAEEEVKEGNYYARERNFGQYVRYITLPSRVDAEKITATLKKGLLKITMPKAENPEIKKIEVKTK
jgi:HSP20 family protein